MLYIVLSLPITSRHTPILLTGQIIYYYFIGDKNDVVSIQSEVRVGTYHLCRI